jgi:putative ATP-dependent endonuclease of the OLD family
MKIVNLGIANFRSFDSEGVLIENIKKLNILIGKNNSGKSNVLRFFNQCSKGIRMKNETRNISNLLRKELDKHENYFQGNKKNPEITISIKAKDILEKLIEYIPEISLLTMKIDLFENKIIKKCEILDKLDDKQLFSLQNKFSSASRKSLLEHLNKELSEKLLRIFFNLFDKMIFIPDFRQIIEQEREQEPNTINGQNIISEMFKIQNPKYGEEGNKEKFAKIQEFVRDLLDEQSVNIEIPYDKEKILLEMNGNRLPLESFGTGIHELVIICSALALYEKHIVCIEEPEIHLHPYLQRKLMNFLIDKTNNIYFITTHSNVFLDFNKNASVYHVAYNKSKTSISYANTNEQSCAILNDLGYKASDLLQSNGIIWVEGPSDRIFLNRWINLLRNDFIEGIHYTIMFYGGRLLSHLSMTKKEFLTDKFIELLRINRNSMIIIDRDGISSQSQINDTKKRINHETKKGNCWITKGREIENYISKDTIIYWLKDKFPEKQERDFKVKTNENDKFENIITKSNKNIKIKYNKEKVAYSKEIIKKIENRDLGTLDLKYRLNFLIKNIEEWNYMGNLK